MGWDGSSEKVIEQIQPITASAMCGQGHNYLLTTTSFSPFMDRNGISLGTGQEKIVDWLNPDHRVRAVTPTQTDKTGSEQLIGYREL